MKLVPQAYMVQCQNCGQGNADQSQFCRFCGNRIAAHDSLVPQGRYQPSPPRPYAWQTDEYQTQAERRVNPLPGTPGMNAPYMPAQPLAYRGAQGMSANYRCPSCGTTVLPVIERRISTAGWVVFAALLVFTFIFFWVGLLMKENVSVCPVCRAKLS